jgi:hypothetical protein
MPVYGRFGLIACGGCGGAIRCDIDTMRAGVKRNPEPGRHRDMVKTGWATAYFPPPRRVSAYYRFVLNILHRPFSAIRASVFSA